ncbi:MAG TPA: hemerythrin domain-containing protein [Aquabacterium sp.]|nr:hemerythrin domain-containing protein [Aquabacterium sp.]
MPASTHTSSERDTERSTTAKAVDATKLLSADHKEVKKLFKEYDKLAKAEATDEEKQAVAEQICTMLTVHATIEEEIFYPAAREAMEERDLLDEAEVEHASAKDLIAHIRGMSPGDELYDAKVKVLGEYVDHHVQEEEKELFPKLRKADLDLKEIGAALEARKQQLMNEMV